VTQQLLPGNLERSLASAALLPTELTCKEGGGHQAASAMVSKKTIRSEVAKAVLGAGYAVVSGLC
jgi:hypothetical protein